MLTHQPCTDGHLGCLHLWPVVNNAAVNMGYNACFETLLLILWGICGIIRPSGNSLLIFEDPSFHIIFHRAALVHTPTTSAQVLQFLHILTNTGWNIKKKILFTTKHFLKTHCVPGLCFIQELAASESGVCGGAGPHVGSLSLARGRMAFRKGGEETGSGILKLLSSWPKSSLGSMTNILIQFAIVI